MVPAKDGDQIKTEEYGYLRELLELQVQELQALHMEGRIGMFSIPAADIEMLGQKGSHSMKDNITILIADSVWFYSQNDEAAFFGWLEKIDCVTKYDGQGTVLYIHVDSPTVDEVSLRDLLALFYRYKIDMKQLIRFERPEFSEWFRGKDSYWYASVFE